MAEGLMGRIKNLFKAQQLVPYFKSQASGLASFLFWDDQLAGLCMVPAWCFWSCMVLLHVVVGGA